MSPAYDSSQLFVSTISFVIIVILIVLQYLSYLCPRWRRVHDLVHDAVVVVVFLMSFGSQVGFSTGSA